MFTDKNPGKKKKKDRNRGHESSTYHQQEKTKALQTNLPFGDTPRK